MHCDPVPLPYSVCRSVKIATMEEKITIGYRHVAGIAEGEARTVIFVLKNINRVGSVGSVDIRAAGAESMCR
jgi:hypothetical protein